MIMSKGVRSKRLWLVIETIRANPRAFNTWLTVHEVCKYTWQNQACTPRAIRECQNLLKTALWYINEIDGYTGEPVVISLAQQPPVAAE
jgi:hypothetical protein